MCFSKEAALLNITRTFELFPSITLSRLQARNRTRKPSPFFDASMFAVHSTKVCIQSSGRPLDCGHREGRGQNQPVTFETWKPDRQPAHFTPVRGAPAQRGVLLTGRAEQTDPIKAFSGPNSCCSHFPGERVKNHGEDERR